MSHGHTGVISCTPESAVQDVLPLEAPDQRGWDTYLTQGSVSESPLHLWRLLRS